MFYLAGVLKSKTRSTTIFKGGKINYPSFTHVEKLKQYTESISAIAPYASQVKPVSIWSNQTVHAQNRQMYLIRLIIVLRLPDKKTNREL